MIIPLVYRNIFGAENLDGLVTRDSGVNVKLAAIKTETMPSYSRSKCIKR